ncbi:hypothetical protein ONS95_008654 [Cadophora gregata]|uniref:uncharacterized protein n=1 Tax=Cadophora gregata TaxID=51156 RepID=UPI0026DD22DF|nr:uncharacterized protein ONS95_008654 [Cadophora gregata]KAK0123639.1 hypothetical protein ONS95_008654 [Cadophora gregata]KAK0129979.1 hypothetical protein ONS96_000519 [Cadophora gregata f. sp. sojae]
MSFFNVFTKSTRSGDAWFSAGPSTSYPNITESGSTTLSDRLLCQDTVAPGCRVFYVPSDDSSQASEIDRAGSTGVPADLTDQVVVFQYQGDFHAVDHSCPHSSYPLSKGTLFDIEDFGVRLSAGIRCPKHDWSFDLVRGNGDRGNYRLKIWEVQLRPIVGGCDEAGRNGEVKEVWVRRKQRMG